MVLKRGNDKTIRIELGFHFSIILRYFNWDFKLQISTDFYSKKISAENWIVIFD